jgi:hypothetical protein
VAELSTRFRDLMRTPPTAASLDSLLDSAFALSGDDDASRVRLHAARCRLLNAGGRTDEAAAHAERAVALARAREADPALMSVALEAAGDAAAVRGLLGECYRLALQRVALLERLPIHGRERVEILVTAIYTGIRVGDFARARRFGTELVELSRARGVMEDNPANFLAVADYFLGAWDDALAEAVRMREGWIRAGRPAAGYLAGGAAAAAAIAG